MKFSSKIDFLQPKKVWLAFSMACKLKGTVLRQKYYNQVAKILKTFLRPGAYILRTNISSDVKTFYVIAKKII